MSKFGYLSLNKKGINSEDIVSNICVGGQIIGCLNSLWWDKTYLCRQKAVRKSYGLSVACYGCEAWLPK